MIKSPNKKNLILSISVFLVLFSFVFILYRLPEEITIVKQGQNFSIRPFRDTGDLFVYWNRQLFLQYQLTPFVDWFIEYPFHALWIFTLPALFTQNVSAYLPTFSFFMAAVWGAVIITSLFFYQKKAPNKNSLLLFLPSILFFVFYRFDAVPALFVLFSIFFLKQQKLIWSFVSLGLAIGIKLYAWPLFFLYLIYMAPRVKNNRAEKRSLFLASLFCALIVFLPIILNAASIGYKSFSPYLWQLQRVPNLASHWGVISGLAARLKMPNIYITTRAVIKIFSYLGTASLLTLLAIKKETIKFTRLVRLSAALTGSVIFFNEFYSPQWIIWIAPLFVISKPTRKQIALFISYDLINYLEYSIIYHIDPYSAQHAAITIARSAILLYLFLSLYMDKKTTRVINMKNLSQK